MSVDIALIDQFRNLAVCAFTHGGEQHQYHKGQTVKVLDDGNIWDGRIYRSYGSGYVVIIPKANHIVATVHKSPLLLCPC